MTRVCARCGGRHRADHRRRTFSPARAAVAVCAMLPDGAAVDGRMLAGTPAEVEAVLAAVPPWRRERLHEQLPLDEGRGS